MGTQQLSFKTAESEALSKRCADLEVELTAADIERSQHDTVLHLLDRIQELEATLLQATHFAPALEEKSAASPPAAPEADSANSPQCDRLPVSGNSSSTLPAVHSDAETETAVTATAAMR